MKKELKGAVMERRRGLRKAVRLDAEIIAEGIRHRGTIVNLSDEGLFMITATLQNVIALAPNSPVKLRALLPSSDPVSLDCQVKWFLKKASPRGSSFKVGLEIMNPPFQYIRFMQSRISHPVR